MTIWKYQLEITDRQEITVPAEGIFLCAQTQHGIPCLWAEVDPDKPHEKRIIRIIGTGNPGGDLSTMNYLGTVQTANGQLIWHIYEEAE